MTTTTLSEDQFAVATGRVRAAGLTGRITLLRTDYRDLPDLVAERGRRFDKLASIEMIEAVGEAWLDRYLGVVEDLLEPHGKALIQAILMADRYYDDYCRTPDLIQRLIFPGTHLPSLSDLLGRAARVTTLTLAGLDDITPHYAETLFRWRERFIARRERVRALGYSEEFCRLWELYLSYCEGGFREGVIRDAQLLLEGPRAALARNGRADADQVQA